MRYILTNDDGIDAPGIVALEAAAAPLGEVLVVAPHEAVSECAHRVTTKAHIAVEARGPHRFAVHGTPADCVRVALLEILPSLNWPLDRADLRVLSGINSGGNLGADVYVSGTVAAAREAAFFGLPAVALSQYLRRTVTEIPDWPRAGAYARRVLDYLQQQNRWDEATFWNANFPALDPAAPDPPITPCTRSRRPLPVKYEPELLDPPHADTPAIRHLKYVTGRYAIRDREPGSDVAVCFGGAISLTLEHL